MCECVFFDFIYLNIFLFFCIIDFYFQVSVAHGATAVVDPTTDAGEEHSDGEELSIRPSNGAPRGMTRDIDTINCYDAVFFFMTFLPRLDFDRKIRRLDTKIIHFSTTAHMWPLALLQILTKPWKPTIDQNLQKYLSSTDYESFCRLSLYSSNLPIAAHLNRIEKKHELLRFLDSSLYIEKFLNLVLYKILKPIEEQLKSKNFDHPLLGLIPISLQYEKTTGTPRSSDETSFPLLSNSALIGLAQQFSKLRFFFDSCCDGAIRYKDLRCMIKAHNEKKFCLR